RAVAVARRSTSDPLVVVGDDGDPRTFSAPELADVELRTTSLSPDGTRLALPTEGSLVVLDVTTGGLRSFAVTTTARDLAWRGAHTVVMVAGPDAVLVNVDTGTTEALSGVRGQDVVSARGPSNDTLTELTSPLVSANAPPRIRTWPTPQ